MAVGLPVDVRPATRPNHDLRGTGPWRPALLHGEESSVVTGLPAVDLVLGVLRLEQVPEAADRLRAAQPEKAGRLQGVVQARHDLLLQHRLQVDQEVAATDQVDAREGRVGQYVVPREDAGVTDRLLDAVAAVDLDEEPPQAFGRHVLGDVLRFRPARCHAHRDRLSTAVSSRSVAKSCSGTLLPAASANSAYAMASEYASWPVEQPNDQIRTGSWGGRSLIRRGKTLLLMASNASGLRKKLVMLIRMSWYSASSSAGCCWRKWT